MKIEERKVTLFMLDNIYQYYICNIYMKRNGQDGNKGKADR